MRQLICWRLRDIESQLDRTDLTASDVYHRRGRVVAAVLLRFRGDTVQSWGDVSDAARLSAEPISDHAVQREFDRRVRLVAIGHFDVDAARTASFHLRLQILFKLCQ